MIIKIGNVNCRLYPMLVVADGDDQEKYVKYFKEHNIKYGLGQVFEMGTPFDTKRYNVRHISIACTEEEMDDFKVYFGDIIDTV